MAVFDQHRIQNLVVTSFSLVAPLCLIVAAISFSNREAQGEQQLQQAIDRYHEIAVRAQQVDIALSINSAALAFPFATATSRQEAEAALQDWTLESAEGNNVNLVLFSAAPLDDFETVSRVAMRFEGQGNTEDFYRFIADLNQFSDQKLGYSRLSIRRANRAQSQAIVTFQFLAWVYVELEN